MKRKWPPPLHKKGGRPPKLRARHFVYDLVQDTSVTKKPDIKIILNQFVDGKNIELCKLKQKLNKCLTLKDPVRVYFCIGKYGKNTQCTSTNKDYKHLYGLYICFPYARIRQPPPKPKLALKPVL